MSSRIAAHIGLTLYTCCFLLSAFSQQSGGENNSPKVTITTPLNDNKLQWNSVVPYTIRVADAEDGNSDYGEISNNEVLLVIKYVPDSTQAKKYLVDRSRLDHEPLLWMTRTTCFSCHAAKTTLIGPSFYQIAQRYRGQLNSIDSLSKKIINGSTGTWGDLKMPPHPELKADQVKKIVEWILKNNDDPDQDYKVGIEGVFRTKAKPVSNGGKGAYILMAIYGDHGPKNVQHDGGVVQQGSKTGQQSVVLRNMQ